MTKEEAEAFLAKEMRLLDEGHLEEWARLFTEDAVYWFPREKDSPREPDAAIIFDTGTQRTIRVKHLVHEEHLAQMPKSETVHYFSNIEMGDPVGEDKAFIRCNVLVYEIRPGGFHGLEVGRGVLRPFPARCEYRLQRPAEWLIEEKKVLLLNRGEPIYNLTFLI